MSASTKVTVVLTDGPKSYKFYWFAQAKCGIYHGFYVPGRGVHNSYHVDGSTWCTDKKRSIPTGNLVPYKDIRDWSCLVTLATKVHIHGRLNEHLIVWYNKEKIRNPVFLDLRNFPKNSTINIQFILVRPEAISKLMDKNRIFENRDGKNYHLIQIVNAINPWLIIHAFAINNVSQKK